jgi:hypothetical protein
MSKDPSTAQFGARTAAAQMGGLQSPVDKECLFLQMATNSFLEHVQKNFGLLPESTPHFDYHFSLPEDKGIRDLFNYNFRDLTPLGF